MYYDDEDFLPETIPSAEERVELGAIRLDHIHPDWYREIEFRFFSIADCQRCILGQIGGYNRWLTTLGNDVEEYPEKYGFELYYKVNEDERRGEEIVDLESAWKDAIQKRK